MTFKQFMKDLRSDKGVTGSVLNTIFYSVLTSFIVIALLYFTRLSIVPEFKSNYSFFLFFAVLTYALISGVLLQIRAYKQFPCMSGMMLGMTAGMIAGFLPGFFIAATNGMFIGTVFGVAFGIFVGILSGGLTCGVMGFIEGVMSGFMGGLMGAMTSFMLFNDHLRASTYLVFGVCAVILGALNYMLYQEGKQLEGKTEVSHFFTIAFSFVAIVLTIWLMVYGPRSGVFG